MAATDVPVFDVNPPPRPFAVASWIGMSPEAIAAGLADGSIAPPLGAPADWTPPGFGPLPGPATSSSDTGQLADAVPIGPTIADRSRVRGWFHALDAGLSDASFESLWQRAGDSDAARGAALTGYLARTLLGASNQTAIGAANVNLKAASDISTALDAFMADPSHRAQVVDLSGMDGTELARRAQTDIGYRVAMTQFDGIALTGNRALFASANANGHLDRFDPDTGEGLLSDAWLADRGKFLAWKLAGDSGGSLDIGGDQAWTFIDRATLDAEGRPLTVHLKPNNLHAQQNQVIFGAESGEVIKGGMGTDRIYGGGGDDVMRGAAGADHLEGGQGDDVAFGGAGDDELAGNQGNDELDGGRGSDRLDGGSGDDTLTGGRGDDQLAGGIGVDSYAIDAGDGTDTISDTDGRGAVVLDDSTITGATADASGNWVSADGRIDFAVDGDLAAESTLTIRAYAAGADHGEIADNVIKVQHWHNGDLGITLGAGGPTKPAADLPGPVDPGPHSQLSSDNSLTDVAGGSSGNDAAATGDGTGDVPNDGGAWVDGPIVQPPAIDAPPLEAPTSSGSFDVNAAIDQLLAPSSTGGPVLDPMRVQHAVAAFSGVLAPPDIMASHSADVGAASGGITLADVADALAHDTGGQDFGHEPAGALPRLAPDWHHIVETAVPVDGSSRGTATSMARVARP
jgi:Ca2+-binding RTX toxin-like protein